MLVTQASAGFVTAVAEQAFGFMLDLSRNISSLSSSYHLQNTPTAKMGRELAHGPVNTGPVYIWGVQVLGGHVYASDMLNGIWKLDPVP